MSPFDGPNETTTIPGYSILIILLLKAFFFINNGFEIAGK